MHYNIIRRYYIFYAWPTFWPQSINQSINQNTFL